MRGTRNRQVEETMVALHEGPEGMSKALSDPSAMNLPSVPPVRRLLSTSAGVPGKSQSAARNLTSGGFVL